MRDGDSILFDLFLADQNALEFIWLCILDSTACLLEFAVRGSLSINFNY